MRDFWFVAKHDVRYMLTRKETLLWLFVMPVFFFFLIGSITGGSSQGGAPTERLTLHGGEAAGPLTALLERRLEDQGFTLDRSEGEPPVDARRLLLLPPEMSESVRAGRQAELIFERNGEGPSVSYDRFRVSRASYTLLADLITAQQLYGSGEVDAIRQVQQQPRALTMSVAPAGRRKSIPTGFSQAVPGTMVMFTLIVLLTSGSVLLVVERKQGLLRRLASTPLSRRSIVWGKWAARVVLGWAQIGFALLAGKLFFKVEWGGQLPMLLVVLAVYSGLIAWVGMLVGSLAKSEGQAVGIGVLSSNLLAALGGCWWPIEVTPRWMQSLADWIPTGWAMGALHKLVSFGEPASSVVTPVLLMLGSMLLVSVWTVKRFRFD